MVGYLESTRLGTMGKVGKREGGVLGVGKRRRKREREGGGGRRGGRGEVEGVER